MDLVDVKENWAARYDRHLHGKRKESNRNKYPRSWHKFARGLTRRQDKANHSRRRGVIKARCGKFEMMNEADMPALRKTT